MNIVELQEKIKAEILGKDGIIIADQVALHIAMIQSDIAVINKRLKKLESNQ